MAVSKTRGSVYMMAAKLLLIGLQFVSIPVYWKVLGVGTYGVLVFITFVKTWVGVVDLGLPTGGQQLLATLFGKDEAAAWVAHRCNLFLSILIGLLGMAILAGFGPVLGIPKNSPVISDIPLLYLLVGVQFLIDQYRTAISAPLYSREMFGQFAVLQSVVPAVCLVVDVAAVLIWRVPLALVCGWVFESLLGLVLAAILVRRQDRAFPFLPRFNRADAKAIMSIGIRVFGGSFSTKIGQTFDTLIVGKVLGADAESYYTVARRIPQVLQELLTGITLSVVPEMTRKADDAEEFALLTRSNARVILTVGASCILVVGGFGTSVLMAWFHKDVPFGGAVCFVMSGYYTLELLYGAITRAFLAKNLMHFLIPFSWWNAAVTALATGPIGSRWGLPGVAFMNLGIDVVQFVPIILLTTKTTMPAVNPWMLMGRFLSVLSVGLAFALGGYWLTALGPLRGHAWAGVFLAALFCGLSLATLVLTRIGSIPDRVVTRLQQLRAMVRAA